MMIRRTMCLSAALFVVLFSRAVASDGAPDGWIVLSDGLDGWREPSPAWRIAGDARVDPENERQLEGLPGEGALVHEKGRTTDLVSQRAWGDVEVQLEFMIPARSNSGVKLQGLYEVQIVDSWKVKEATAHHCGGIYPRAELKPRYHHIDDGIPPQANAAKRPGQWQSLRIVFRAPRFDEEGEKTANARFEKVVLNGTTIHEDVELPYPTGHAWRRREEPAGPLLLQADHGPVAFRNVRVRPLPAPPK
jgi:hypothetical protein